MSKESAIDYWQNQKDNADSFAGYLGAHLMGLNAEVGYSIAECIQSLAETVSDPEKLKAAAVNAYEGTVDVITDPMGTVTSIKDAAVEFSELPAGEQADAVYKGAIGMLAGGGGSLKAAGGLGKLAKKKIKKAPLKQSYLQKKLIGLLPSR